MLWIYLTVLRRFKEKVMRSFFYHPGNRHRCRRIITMVTIGEVPLSRLNNKLQAWEQTFDV